MTLYGTALFVHVLAAIGLVGTTVTEHVAMSRARQARSVDALRGTVAVAHAVGRWANPLALIVVAAGLYLAFAGSWWGAGWPVVSLVLFALAGTGAGLVTDPWIARVGAAAEDADIGHPVPAAASAALADPTAVLVSWLMSGLDAAIVALMTNKPGYAGALSIAAIALVVAAGLGLRETATMPRRQPRLRGGAAAG